MNQLGHFEENLLTELREVVAARTGAPPRRGLPRKRLALAAAGGGLLAAGLLVGIPAMGGEQHPTAYAVTTNDDGTVTVRINRIEDAEGLEREIEAHGVAAEVDYAPPGKMCRETPPRYERDRGPQKGVGALDWLGAPNGPDGPPEKTVTLYPAQLTGRTVVFETIGHALNDANELTMFHINLGVADGPVAPCVLVDVPGL